MVRRPVAWVVAVVLLVEALSVVAVNWFLGVVVDRQKMSLAGLDPDVMATSSKIGGVVFGLYFALCALVAVVVAVRDRAPAGFGRVVLISAAVVHALLGAFAWGLFGVAAFVFMVAVLGLIVLLLMTYDRAAGPRGADAGGTPGQGAGPAAGPEPGAEPVDGDAPAGLAYEPQDGDEDPRDSVPSQGSAHVRVSVPGPTTP
ncbi:hypothetical protein [Streptomyces sp. WELS2]|uniref:hypothetical protein n=1 Tax=Streptomyces sp. WELS2 TaxID=2749435 RepID=UPI0015F00C54|nr:hypothetical protein [Streptomyces sp. WELS2]